QAEDGIRDRTVTGVQTCALPIFSISWPERSGKLVAVSGAAWSSSPSEPAGSGAATARFGVDVAFATSAVPASALWVFLDLRLLKIGRASCRERVSSSERAQVGKR